MTEIAWTDKTWNVSVGCSRISTGCENCYAERFAHRGLTEAHRGLTTTGPKGPRWTGEVRCLPERLDIPLHWRKPRRVFVDSMSDLFHEKVPGEFIAWVWDTMRSCPQHTFQVLTKRSERMMQLCGHGGVLYGYTFEPLPNVHLGYSASTQKDLDAGVPHLLNTPAAVRFLSLEPLLEAIRFLGPDFSDRGHGPGWLTAGNAAGGPSIHWVITGGESGPGARPCHVNWIRSIRDQCREAGVPLFIKQLGSAPFGPLNEGFPDNVLGDWSSLGVKRKGSDPEQWPVPLRVREWPGEGGGNLEDRG